MAWNVIRMILTTETRRQNPAKSNNALVLSLRGVGPLTDEYSLISDWHDEWLTGGTESDVIAEAHLDPESVFQAVKRFAQDHDSRISHQAELLKRVTG